MRGGYFRTVWRDIKESPGWFGRLVTLALVGLIPLFGPIVVLGYAYGWAREVAWGVHTSLPPQVLGGGDGKLYSRGFSAFIILLVCGVIPVLVNAAFSALSKVAAVVVGVGSGALRVLIAALAGFGALASIIAFALAVFLLLFRWVGTMRMSIYGRLSAGFQIRKIWAMIRYDVGGLMRVAGMALIMAIVAAALMVVVFVGDLLVLALGLLVSSGFDLGFVGDVAAGDFTSVPLSLVILVVLAAVVTGFVFMMAWSFIELTTSRAMGYWTAQFDVMNWRGQDDPMPFEVAGAYAAGAAQGPYRP